MATLQTAINPPTYLGPDRFLNLLILRPLFLETAERLLAQVGEEREIPGWIGDSSKAPQSRGPDISILGRGESATLRINLTVPSILGELGARLLERLLGCDGR